MPLILAIEPDRRQAAQVTTIARGLLHVELVLAESSERALAALGSRVPDLILTSALLSPKDEAALADRLRELDSAAAHVQTLTIPVLAAPKGRGSSSTGVLSRLRKGSRKGAAPDGCDPKVFAEQISEYLERAEAERAAAAARAADQAELSRAAIKTEPAQVARAAADPIAEFVADPVAAEDVAPAEPVEAVPESHAVAAEPSYVEPESTYSAPEPSYVAPEPTYVAPEPTYSAPEPSYIAREPSDVTPEPSDVTAAPRYTAPEPAYAEPEPEPVAFTEPAPLIAPEPEPVAAAVETPAVEEPRDEDAPPPVSIDALLAQLVSAAPLQPEIAPEPIVRAQIAPAPPEIEPEVVAAPPIEAEPPARVAPVAIAVSPPPVAEEAQPAIVSEPEAVAAFEATRVEPPVEPVAGRIAAEPPSDQAPGAIDMGTSEVDLSAFLEELRASIDKPVVAARGPARTIKTPPPEPVIEAAAPLEQEPVFAAAPPPESVAPPVEPTAPPLQSMIPEVEAPAPVLEAAAPMASEAPAEPLLTADLSAHDLAAFEEALAEHTSLDPVPGARREPLPATFDAPEPVASVTPPPTVTSPRVVPRPPAVTLPPAPVIAARRPVAAEPVPVGPPRRPVAPARSTPAPVEAPAAAAKPEWADLLDALRREVEHLRTERAQAVDASPADASARSTPKNSGKNRASKTAAGKKKKREKTTPAQDEWGFFDPEQCGFAALLAKLDEISEDDDVQQPA